MKNLLTTLLLAFVCISSFAQLRFYSEVSATYSFIPEHTNTIFPYLQHNYSYDTKPGFQIVVGVSKNIASKFSVDVGLGYTYYNFQPQITSQNIIVNGELSSPGDRKVVVGEPTGSWYGLKYLGVHANEEVVAQDADGNTLYDLEGNPITLDYQTDGTTGTFINSDSEINNSTTTTDLSDNRRTQISYFIVPVNFNYDVMPDKIRVGIGVVNAVVITSSIINYQPDINLYYDSNNDATPDYWSPNNSTNEYFSLDESDSRSLSYLKETDRTSNGLKNYQVHANASILYNIFNHLWLKAEYSHGLLSIYNDNLNRNGAKFRTIQLGIRYYWN